MGRRAMAIGAHPDDVEIACGGTVAKMHDAGYVICLLIMTKGERGGDARTRVAEARKAVNHIGIEQTEFLDFTDTKLYQQINDMQATLEARILDFQPHIILTHSVHDLHQDHVAVHEATLRAARDFSSILCYESPSSALDYLPCFFVHVGPFVEAKLRAVKEHRDQIAKSYSDEQLLRAKMLFRGNQARVDSAEAFEVVRLLSSDIGGV